MDFNERWEQYRVSQLAYMQTQIAVMECDIARWRKDIEFWSEPALSLTERERLLLLETLKSSLERALRDREKYRVRIAKYEGFDIVRADVH